MPNADSFVSSIRRFFSEYLTSLGARGAFGALVLKATKDAPLRARLLAAPHDVIAEAGIKLPAGMTVRVFENTPQEIHLVLPPMVAEASREGEDA